MKKNRNIYVTVYAITRNYGGPQEGGWWWNAYWVDSTHCYGHSRKSMGKARRSFDKARKEASDYSWGNIYSAAGGVEYVARLEIGKQHRSWETIGRPRYE